MVEPRARQHFPAHPEHRGPCRAHLQRRHFRHQRVTTTIYQGPFLVLLSSLEPRIKYSRLDPQYWRTKCIMCAAKLSICGFRKFQGCLLGSNHETSDPSPGRVSNARSPAPHVPTFRYSKSMSKMINSGDITRPPCVIFLLLL